ncbi:MAG: class II aldolase/adducin family protein [Betaproteobacteria bacterium]|nr:class II aldolase/adducin family protein [Betaproteobacteria bacterium]
MAQALRVEKGNKADITDAEQRARVELAAAYRIAAFYGWGNLIYNHIALRIPDQPECFLVKPHVVMFSEVRASQLVKLRIDGAQVTEADNINSAAFTIHTAILRARPDINCTIHVHPNAAIAMSAHKRGILPLNQGAMRFYNRLSWHDYEGIADALDEAARLARDIGPTNKAMLLRNHGPLTGGATASEAITLMRYLVQASEIQLMLEASGTELQMPPPEVCERTAKQWDHFQKINEQEDWRAYLRHIDAIDTSYRN